MNDTIEYKILKYLFENDDGNYVDVSNLEIEKNLLKTKLIELRAYKLAKTNFGEYAVRFGDGTGIKSKNSFLSKITIDGKRFISDIEKNTDRRIINDFSGSSIGQINQPDSLNIRKANINQTNSPITKSKKERSIWVKVFWYIIIPLMVGIILIALERIL